MNEQLYVKVGRRYVKATMPEQYHMADGIWIVQNKSYSIGMSSLCWKVGDLKRPADIVTHAGLQTLTDDLVTYLTNLGDDKSKDFIEAKEVSGAGLTRPVSYHNISASQLVSLFIRKIATYLEEGRDVHWDSLQYKFRDETKLHTKPEWENGVKVLYQFTQWLKANNVKFRQNNNIG